MLFSENSCCRHYRLPRILLKIRQAAEEYLEAAKEFPGKDACGLCSLISVSVGVPRGTLTLTGARDRFL